ncbi:MAG: sensor histidine kinase [Hyphomonadaceae bacterium]
MSADKRSTRRFPRTPVSALIIALILALAAPSLAFVAVLLLQSDTISHRQMAARAQEGVGAISQTLDHELRSMVTTLSVFAASGWIETEEYKSLHANAKSALDGTPFYLTAVDRNTRQILNTRVDWGTPLNPISHPDTVRQAMETGQPAVSDVFVGQIAKTEVFNIALPIISDEVRAKALIMSRSIVSLAPIFQDNLPPPGWTYAVLDRNGKLASGSTPPVNSETMLKELCAPGDGDLLEREAGGVRYSAAARTVAPWGWTACVWTSSQQADADTTQRWRNFTILAIVVVVVTILSGAALGQMLAGAIRRAATVGKALDAGGDVPEMHSVVREVDDVLGTLTRAARRRLQHEQEQTILLRETAHRAKNQIAIATALAKLSARSAQSVEQLRDDVVARLTALGQSIDMMSKSPSGAVRLRDLLAGQLAAFVAGHETRLELQGADLRVSPTTAQSLGLVVHEMATNAAKYGAWSVPEGRVRVDWSKTDEGGLVITWIERGGPAPKPQDQAGFGSSLIEMMIERTLGGTVTRDYGPAGLAATFKLRPEGPLG